MFAMITSGLLFVLCCFQFTGCNSRPKNGSPQVKRVSPSSVVEGLKYSLEKTIDLEQNDSAFIATSVGFEVEPSGYFVGDAIQSCVFRYGLDGKYISTFGGAGDGPSEIRKIGRFSANGKYVACMDAGILKIKMFNMQGNVERSFPRSTHSIYSQNSDFEINGNNEVVFHGAPKKYLRKRNIVNKNTEINVLWKYKLHSDSILPLNILGSPYVESKAIFNRIMNLALGNDGSIIQTYINFPLLFKYNNMRKTAFSIYSPQFKYNFKNGKISGSVSQIQRLRVSPKDRSIFIIFLGTAHKQTVEYLSVYYSGGLPALLDKNLRDYQIFGYRKGEDIVRDIDFDKAGNLHMLLSRYNKNEIKRYVAIFKPKV